MAGMRLEFAQFGSFDSFSIYRSEFPMNPSSLPAPIATDIRQMYFIDGTALEEKRYYYRVAVIRGSDVLLSDEIISPDNNTAPAENIPTDYILRYDFNGNAEDKSPSGLDGVLVGAVTFGAGRTANSSAAIFNGGTVKTNAVLPVNSSKISISFWFKTNNTAPSFPMVLGNSANTKNFVLQFHNAESSAIGMQSFNGASSNHGATEPGVTNGAWHHVIFTVDRLGSTHREVTNAYLNGSIIAAPMRFFRNDLLSGVFDNAVLTIGNHSYSSLNGYPYKGGIQQLRIYNRLLTEVERLQLFEE